MALRRPGRLAVLAVLVGLATVSLAPQAARRSSAGAVTSNTWLSLTIVAGLTVPALVLAVIAAVRFRPRRARAAPGESKPAGNPWLGALILLGFLAIAVLAAVLLRPTRREPSASTDPPPTSATQPPQDPSTTADLPWFVVAVAILAGVLAAAALAHRRRTSTPTPEPARRAPVADAVEEALRIVIEPATDPRTAIIRCYAAMEGALTAIPGATPHPADSAAEVLDRATTAGAIRSPEAWRLVELFDEARFSRHPMSEPDRASAERSLRLILAELGGPR